MGLPGDDDVQGGPFQALKLDGWTVSAFWFRKVRPWAGVHAARVNAGSGQRLQAGTWGRTCQSAEGPDR